MKIFLIFIIVIPVANAFNWQKCKKVYKDSGNFVISASAASASASSYISSTGDCAMIGNITHDKKVFFAQNFNELQIESAKGNGEYLHSYASLSGCNKTGSERLKKALQTNFKAIYGSNVEYTPKKAYEGIENILKHDSVLKKSCHPNTNKNLSYSLPVS
jgi:hypothetical protein